MQETENISKNINVSREDTSEESISKENNIKPSFDELVIKCQQDMLNVIGDSKLPMSVVVLLLEKLMILAEKSMQVGK